MLKLHVSDDFEDQTLNGTTFGQEFSTSFGYGSEFQYFSDKCVLENACLYPYIQPNHANIIFRSVSCEIQDYFEILPTLPSNQFYYPDIMSPSAAIPDSIKIYFSFIIRKMHFSNL